MEQYTVQDAARLTNRTVGRIRQICREHGIGKCHGGRFRALTKPELKRIAKIIAERGWSK